MNRQIRAVPWIIILVAFFPAMLSLNAASKSDLASRVTIRRDTYGIPHILAESEEAAGFGFGYAQAEDHCVVIAKAIVSARGEEARYFGTGAESDFVLALYANMESAALDLKKVSPVYRRIVNAYAEGLNRYVDTHRSDLPEWITKFSGVDVMAMRRAGAIRSTFSQATLRSLQLKYPSSGSGEGSNPWCALLPDSDTEENAPDEPPGSNAFALSGSRTYSGHPILLGNPHLNWSSLYWEAQVTVPGKVDFFGSTLAGIPVLRAGFNRHLGWVTTNNSPDVSDIFALPIDPKQPDHYVIDGKSRPLEKREISVAIRAPDGTLRKEKRSYWDSPLGKILYRTADKAFAVNSTQLDAIHYYEGFYFLSKTSSLKQFLSVMDRNMVPTSNFTYADAEGNIMYMWNARIPARLEDGTDYSVDIPAHTSRYVWKKMLKPRSFPRMINPPGGYIQNCNNPPWYTSMRDLLDPGGYPAHLESDRGLALRPQAALEMLESRSKFAFEDVVRAKFDNRMLLADRVKPALVGAAVELERPISEALQAGVAVLRAWDNRVNAESRGAVLFQRFWDTYSQASPEPYAEPWNPARPFDTPRGLSDRALALNHLENAVLWVRNRYGHEDVPWGQVHRFRFGSLDLPADGASGNYGLFRVVQFNEQPDGKRVAGQIRKGEVPVGFGDAWVIAVEFSNPVRAESVLAYGQTTRSDSGHSTDQISLFAEHKLRPVWFHETEIMAHLERSYRPPARD